MKTNFRKILSLILCVSTLLTSFVILASCKKDDKKPGEELSVIIEDGQTKYTIVRSDRSSKNVTELTMNLRSTLSEKFGCKIDIETDWVKSEDEIDPNAFEILVGQTNRAESKEALESLDNNSWVVKVTDNKVVICATNDTMLAIAVDWFLANYVENADGKLAMPKELSYGEGIGDELPVSVHGISSYTIVCRAGNKNLEYYASLIQKHTKLNGKTIKVANYDVITENVINIAVDSALGDGEYKVALDKTNINITAKDEDTLYYAVNYFLEYGVTVGDTVVTVPKDYSLSGKLENYTASNWDMPIPAAEHKNIAPKYNIGAGLENDKNADTITDSYLHLLSLTSATNFENYKKKLESFGFKNVYSANTDGNTLTCYRLGEALVYIHFCPKTKAMRVIWDKSSTCEINDVSYTAEGNGTTTFYQYSLDYTNAPLNYTGQGINCGMLYIIKLADNSLILVDSGHNRQSKDESLRAIYDFLYEITGTPKKEQLTIRFWYYTHPDGDHNELTMNLFDYIKSHGLKTPKVEALGFAYPSERANDKLGKTDGSYEMLELMKTNFPDIKYLKLHTGMVFNIGEVKFEVLSTIENFVTSTGKINANYNTNDVCSVVRFSFDGMSVLMQGDQGGGAEKEKYLTSMYSSEYIVSDVIQIAHHGFNNTTAMFGLCKSKYAFLSNSMANINDSVKKTLVSRTKMPVDNILAAGDYTYGLKMTNGQIEVLKIMRYDNPNKK